MLHLAIGEHWPCEDSELVECLAVGFSRRQARPDRILDPLKGEGEFTDDASLTRGMRIHATWSWMFLNEESAAVASMTS